MHGHEQRTYKNIPTHLTSLEATSIQKHDQVIIQPFVRSGLSMLLNSLARVDI